MDAQAADAPVFFERNRVSRVHRGGLLFHDFFGDPPRDGSEPEEWIASTVRALNQGQRDPLEGISRLEGSGLPFTEFLAAHREQALGGCPDLGVLVKVLDSAIRLSVQAHPDKAFARRHLHSEHGKTEAWLVLATRPNASIHLGFRRPLTKKQFREAIDAAVQERGALSGLLNELPARAGDVYLIPPRMVHAIGAGCLILEVQEPTDFTIAPEAWCGDHRLDERQMYLGLDREVALECFDLELAGEKAVRASRMRPRVFAEKAGLVADRLVSREDTPDFAVNRYRLQSSAAALDGRPGVYVVTGGAGFLSCCGRERAIAKGASFFLPAAAGETTVRTDGALEVIECLPPGSL